MKTPFWALVKKEYFGFVNSPLAYVIIVPFLLLMNFLFFRTALVLGDANLRPFIELLPWFLIVIGPALAMRTFAEEQRRSTIELLFAHPVSEWAIVGAKYAGLFFFYATMLLTTVAMPATLMAFSTPDVGLIVAQYLGALLVGSVFMAVGLCTSVLVRSSVGSFLLGAAINFGLILIGLSFIVLMFPAPLGRIVQEVAIQPHVNNISRGVIDLRDVLYFVTLVGIALAAAVLRLSERKLAENPQERSKLLVILGLVLAVGVVGNVVMYAYPIRLDLTANKRYSMTRGTRQLLRELPDRVTLTLYTSDNLPGPMQVNLREASDLLKDFSRYGDKLQAKTVIVTADAQSATEARQKGMREVQFNQIGAGSFAVQTGFLGIEARYGDKTEVIDFIEEAGNLEYELARRVLKLTRDTQPRIGLIDRTGNSPLSNLNQLLADQYQMVSLSDSSGSETWKDLTGIVLFDDGTGTEGSTVSAELRNYLASRGNAVFFIDGVSVDQQSLGGTANTSAMIDVVAEYGMRLQPNLVYDFQLNESISMGQGNLRYIVSYPFWIRPLIDQQESPITLGGNNVVMGWASEVSLQSVNGWEPKAMLKTSKNSNTQTTNFTLSPQALEGLAPAAGKEMVVAGVAEKDGQRMALVGDTQIAGDDFLQNAEENRVFVANIVDWVAADPILLAIPKRGTGRNAFAFESPKQLQMVQIGNIVVPPLAVAVFGFWWLSRRRRLTQRVYELE